MRAAVARAAWGAAALLVAQGAAASGIDAAEWLVRTSEAARTANYQGTIVYRGDDMLETMRVTHRFENGVERERVQSLTGEPREIQKQDSRVTCLLPKDRKLTMDRPTPKGLFPALTRARVQQIAATYEFQDYGPARLAGRICRGVAITPRDEFRYGYEVWADEKTHVPLKVNLIGRDGTVLEQMMFTEVEFPASIPDTAFQSPLRSEDYQEVTATAAEAAPQQPAANAGNWQFARLPPGYRLATREIRVLPGGKGTVEHLVLSDGLSAISIFSTRKAVRAKVSPSMSQMGAVNAYGRMQGSYHITVVGEAPQGAVRMIGDNIKPGDEAPTASSPQP